jgi:hypothetical protein
MTGIAAPMPVLLRSVMLRLISQRMPAGSNVVAIVPWNGSSARRNSRVAQIGVARHIRKERQRADTA